MHSCRPGFFHSAKLLWDSHKLVHVSIVCGFWLQGRKHPHCTDRPHLFYPLIDWWTVDWFQVLAITSQAAVNIHAKSLDGHMLSFLWGKGLRVEWLLLLYSRCVSYFLRNCPNVFQNGCAIFHSHQKCTRILAVAHLFQHFVYSVFLFLDILINR